MASVVEAAGKHTETLIGHEGSRVLVLPHGGRVLGVFAPGSDENFLWTSAALGDRDSARALFASPEWCNTGGDRTWLAPEADFFLPRYPKTTEYRPPSVLDPGKYSWERSGNSVALENRLTIHSYRTGADVDLVVRKTVEPAADPLDVLGSKTDAQGVHAAGYSLRCGLEMFGGRANAAVGLWNLLQLPRGGEMLIPTRTRSDAVVYFGSIASADLVVEDRLVRWAMGKEGEQKIGLPPGAVAGRAGYISGAGPVLSLVVRDFAVLQQGLYIDAPWMGAAGRACAFQACSVRTARLGSFSELEYHAPAIGGGSGSARSEDTSQVRCFRGPAGRIRAIASALLGA